MYDLKGRVCVVSGASSGIGREICLQLSRCGAVVVCAARRKELLNDTVDLIAKENGIAEALQCDFTVPEQVEELASYVKNKYKKIDLWMNGVGVNNVMGPVWEIGYDEWFADLDGNLKTCYIGTKCAIRAMKDQGFGRIINMSGGGVVRPEPYNSAYACAKTAIVRFTEGVSLELKEENIPIKIFAFGPGLVRTQRTIELVELPSTRKYMPGIIDKIRNDEATPIERPAEFISFIASGAVDSLVGCLLDTQMNKEEIVRDAENIAKEGRYKIVVKP
ncbi:MAG: SDR family oxidoreductase [Bacillota bacterium]